MSKDRSAEASQLPSTKDASGSAMSDNRQLDAMIRTRQEHLKMAKAAEAKGDKQTAASYENKAKELDRRIAAEMKKGRDMSKDKASEASQLPGAKDALTPEQLKEGARKELQEEAKYLRRTGQIGQSRADAEKYFGTIGKYKRLWEAAGRSLGLDADDPIAEGEENGAVQQIKGGVEEFEKIHEKEGYLPPEGLDEEGMPQGREAGTPLPGEPNGTGDDEFPIREGEGKDIEITAEKVRAARSRWEAEVKKQEQIIKAASAQLDKAKTALSDLRMWGNDEAPAGTLPAAGGGSDEEGLCFEGEDEFPEVNNGSEYKGVAMDSAKMADRITKEIQERYRRRDVALDEIRPLVGDLKFSAVANDAAAYAYALKVKGVEPPKGINTAGLRGMVQALIAADNKVNAFASAVAMDAAPSSKKADEYEKLFDDRKTRIL